MLSPLLPLLLLLLLPFIVSVRIPKLNYFILPDPGLIYSVANLFRFYLSNSKTKEGTHFLAY